MSLIANTPPFINDPTVYNETDDVTLTCLSDGMPSAEAVRWNVTISSNPQLTFDHIQRSNASVYTCCAFRRIAGEIVMRCTDFTITVQCEFIIITMHT